MFAKTWIILKNAWFLGKKALPCSISPPVCYLHLTFVSLFEAMSQCINLLFFIFCILPSCIICLYLSSTIITKKTMILLFQIFVSRQLSSIRKVVWLFGGKLGRFWRSGITCVTSVFLSAPTGQQTGKLEYWKTQKLHKLGQASNNCWDLKNLT